MGRALLSPQLDGSVTLSNWSCVPGGMIMLEVFGYAAATACIVVFLLVLKDAFADEDPVDDKSDASR